MNEQPYYMTEEQCKQHAELISQSIVIRHHNENGTNDERRPTTTPEKEIIFKIAYGALLAIAHVKSKKELRAIVDAAEYMMIIFIPECNGYLTLFCPLMNMSPEGESE